MRVSDVEPTVLRGGGALLGLLLALVATRVVDALPSRRYGITHVVVGPPRSRRNAVLGALTTLCIAAIAEVVVRTPELSVAHAAFLLGTNALLVAAVLAAAAIDLEHMILPNELTLGGAVLCVVTSPLRSVGLFGSIAGALTGLAVSYLPLLLYKKLRGQSGMGLGDAKLALMAGAWHGVEGAVFVMFAGALQSTIAAFAMRAVGLRFEEPESVKAEIAELRSRAEAGDEEAARDLADDPMGAAPTGATLGMRLPLGPFLALGCVEVLFFRRWLTDHVLAWLVR